MGEDRYGHQSDICDCWVGCGDILWTQAAEMMGNSFLFFVFDYVVLRYGVGMRNVIPLLRYSHFDTMVL